MALRKITIDNSVKYSPKSEQTRDKDIKPNTIKNKSLPRKQDENISKNIKKFAKDFAAKGFAILKCIMNCYF